MLTIQTASPHPVTHVAFAPDGSAFAVAQPNSGVTVCDRATGQPAVTCPVPRAGTFTSALFCGGGTQIAVSFHKGVFLFDAATGASLGRRGHPNLGNTMLAARGSGLVGVTYGRVWDIPVDGAARPTSRPIRSQALAVAVAPCGRWGFGVYGSVRPTLLDLAAARVGPVVDHPYRYSGYNPATAVFAPNGDRLAVCDGNDITVYDIPAAEPDPDDEDESADGPSSAPRAVAVAPKPRAVLEQPIFRLEPPEGFKPPPRPRLDFAPEDVRLNRNWRPELAFTPDGRGLLVRRPRNRVQLWDVASGSLLVVWRWALDSLTCLAVSPDGLTAFVGARFGKVVMWDLE
jgi:WD40 repeat protein